MENSVPRVPQFIFIFHCVDNNSEWKLHKMWCRPVVRIRQRLVARSDPAVDGSFGQPILGHVTRSCDSSGDVSYVHTYARHTVTEYKIYVYVLWGAHIHAFGMSADLDYNVEWLSGCNYYNSKLSNLQAYARKLRVPDFLSFPVFGVWCRLHQFCTREQCGIHTAYLKFQLCSFLRNLIPAFDRNGQKSSSRGLAVISLAMGKGGN